ncbi:MAG: Uma2 family endonuclease [Planctomycetota bacterium]
MTNARKFVPHYSVEDYRQWEGDCELWSGIAVAMSPRPFGTHQLTLVNLAAEIRGELRAHGHHAVVLVECDWIVSEDSVVRPDLIVLCGDALEKHIESPPPIVAEVLSDSTRERDLTFKRDLYQEHGVDCYLILDPEDRSFQSFRRDANDAFQNERIETSVELTLCNDCHIQLIRDQLFGK